MRHGLHAVSDFLEAPLHGNQGNREELPVLEAPQGLTVAISREAGARGGSIARRVGKKLGWQVYNQELLEFLCGNDAARSHVLADVPSEAAAWADAQLERLRRDKVILPTVQPGEMPRLILTLAARGNAILVGRGAGYLLPRETTLHFRIVAPLEERIAHMMQSLRLTHDAAASTVHERDDRRADFLMSYFGRHANDLHDYDMVLNSALLGEDTCSELIVLAVRARQRQMHPPYADQ